MPSIAAPSKKPSLLVPALAVASLLLVTQLFPDLMSSIDVRNWEWPDDPMVCLAAFEGDTACVALIGANALAVGFLVGLSVYGRKKRRPPGRGAGETCVSANPSPRRPPRDGATLVELLTVISIVTLLMQLLLPAVQMARESARQTSCANNLRQIGVGAQLHTDAHGHFPTGGWTHVWVGDPDRGFGKGQPGGWCFTLLPYIEQQALHDSSRGLSGDEKHAAAAEMFLTPLPSYTCPSRRLPRAWPFLRSSSMVNLAPVERAARSDYAANMGDLEPTDQRARGPQSFEEARRWREGTNRKTHWIASRHNGVVYQRSEVRPAEVTDGLSKTFFAGEKFMDPGHYKDGWSNGDDHSLYVGFDRDNARSGNTLHPPMRDKEVPLVWLAYGDSALVTDWNFGSAHLTSLNMVYCDGSLRRVDYDVDMQTFSDQSSRTAAETRTSPGGFEF